jgi:hypothetical protein
LSSIICAYKSSNSNVNIINNAKTLLIEKKANYGRSQAKRTLKNSTVSDIIKTASLLDVSALCLNTLLTVPQDSFLFAVIFAQLKE